MATNTILEELQTPVLPEALAHNRATLSNAVNLASIILGVVAGTLGLESYVGFIFYFVGSALIAGAVVSLPGRKGYFGKSPLGAVLEEIGNAAMGFVLAWTLIFGIVRS